MICEIDFPDIDGERWRMRFTHAHRVLIAQALDEVAAVIEAAEQAARDGHWVVGFVAYEAALAFDTVLRVNAKEGYLPLAAFAIYSYEEPPRAPVNAEPFACDAWSMATSRDAICSGVTNIRKGIEEGNYYQVNYTTRLTSNFSGAATSLYAALCEAQPGGYNAFIDGGDWQIASVSPELFFDWTPDGTLTTKPMKGTAPRSGDGNDIEALSASPKDRAENLMIVDLLRNDLAHIATTGSVEVTQLFEVEALPTAFQMTSTVRCRTCAETTLVDVFRALFPCGSVTGAPKVAAMQAIAGLEGQPRGVYCGAIGVLRPNGHATFNVAIRTVSVDANARRANCGIGSGIVLDSQPDAEYAEWLVKRRFLLRATASFDLLDTLRLQDGTYWLLEEHLDRLRVSAAHFGFVCDPYRLRENLVRNAEENAAGLWRVRLLLARDGNVRIESHALEAQTRTQTQTRPVRIALAHAPIDSRNEFLYHKTTQREIYAPHAPQEACFDTLMYNERGEITEFTRGNVVVEIDGRRVTPPLSCGLLPGVLRAELLRRQQIVEGIVTRADLARANGLWFINSVRGEIGVTL